MSCSSFVFNWKKFKFYILLSSPFLIFVINHVFVHLWIPKQIPLFLVFEYWIVLSPKECQVPHPAWNVPPPHEMDKSPWTRESQQSGQKRPQWVGRRVQPQKGKRRGPTPLHSAQWPLKNSSMRRAVRSTGFWWKTKVGDIRNSYKLSLAVLFTYVNLLIKRVAVGNMQLFRCISKNYYMFGVGTRYRNKKKKSL